MLLEFPYILEMSQKAEKVLRHLQRRSSICGDVLAQEKGSQHWQTFQRSLPQRSQFQAEKEEHPGKESGGFERRCGNGRILFEGREREFRRDTSW